MPLVDEDPYPPSGCTAAAVCLTAGQIADEVRHYVEANGLPQDIHDEYYVLTPPGVGGCIDAASQQCLAGDGPPEHWVYCAYHTFTHGPLGPIVISNDPYIDGAICDRTGHPNGTTSDATIRGVAHEHSESVTDPELNAWYDSKGEEVGDECNHHNGPEFGTALGIAENGAPYNQVVNGHIYYYQTEFSNIAEECLERTAKAFCTSNAGTLKLSPGLTNSPAIQTVKIKGTLTGCLAGLFTDTNYTATLKTAGPVSCSVLKAAGETATGASKYKWTPKAKSSSGNLGMLVTEQPEAAFTGETTSGSHAPLTLSGKATESYAGGATCGEPVGGKAAKAVKKGTFSGSVVSFE